MGPEDRFGLKVEKPSDNTTIEAEQQGQPKFDTDKLVVDVVLRDIRSNGPIRKAIRSGET